MGPINEDDRTMNEGASNLPGDQKSEGNPSGLPSEEPTELPAQQAESPPVPVERHYLIAKNIESQIKDRLSEIEHPYYFTGFRVAYDLVDSANEPHVFPFSIEFGHLGLLDLPLQCGKPEEIPEEEVNDLTMNAPLTIEFLDTLFDAAEAALQEGTQPPLRVGISIVLNGSRDQGYFVGCSCGNPGRRRRLYCVPNRRTGGQRMVCRRSCAVNPGR